MAEVPGGERLASHLHRMLESAQSTFITARGILKQRSPQPFYNARLTRSGCPRNSNSPPACPASSSRHRRPGIGRRAACTPSSCPTISPVVTLGSPSIGTPDRGIQLVSDGSFHHDLPQCQFSKKRKQISGSRNPERCMGRATFLALSRLRKTVQIHRDTNFRIQGLSHALRHCFIAAKMRELKQFVSASADEKGGQSVYSGRPASDPGCKFFSVLASFVPAEQRQALQQRARCAVSCPPL